MEHSSDECIERAVAAKLDLRGVRVVLRVGLGQDWRLRVGCDELGFEPCFEGCQLSAEFFRLLAELVGHSCQFFVGELAGLDEKRSEAAGLCKRINVRQFCSFRRILLVIARIVDFVRLLCAVVNDFSAVGTILFLPEDGFVPFVEFAAYLIKSDV